MNILFICGSLNQTTMMHKISRHLEKDHRCFFAPYYSDGIIHILAKAGFLKNTILGGRHRRDTMQYLGEQDLPLDIRGRRMDYDLVVTCSDAIIQKNIRRKRLMLVQEGITEPEGFLFHLVRALRLPRWLANTSVTGISNAFDVFCVASRGYKDLFIHKGVIPDKIIVTGIPNFDNLAEVKGDDFPHKNFVLAATTPFRETMRPEIRPLFIKRCVEIADGRQLIFKLHPLEDAPRAISEINRHATGALVYWRGDVNEMIAKASVVITQQSTCTFVALAMGKEVHTDLDIRQLKRLMPIQNGGASACQIARVCRRLLNTPMPVLERNRRRFRVKSFWEKIEI